MKEEIRRRETKREEKVLFVTLFFPKKQKR